MYTPEKSEKQFSFSEGWFMPPDLDQEHFLIKLSRTLPWDELSQKLAKYYCPDNGRPTKPSRVKIGLLIIKHLYQFSDDEALDMLKRDVYVQYLCDISFPHAKNFMNASTLCRFRQDIGDEGMKAIEDTVLNILGKSLKRRVRTLITDTTVVPSNIAYPTDVTLLEKTRRQAVKLLDQAKTLGAGPVRTYKRIARKVFVMYQKIRKHTVKNRRRTQKKLRQFAARNIQQLHDVMTKIKTAAAQSKDKTCQKFINATETFLPTANKIIEQQKKVYCEQKVKDRIVSLHRPEIRPIVRGKFPLNTEFGPKILVNAHGDLLTLEHLTYDNTADSHLFKTAIEGYRQKYGRAPTEVAADRGFWSKDNRHFAENIGVKNIAIENKGKSSYLKGKPFRERLRRRRCGIEARISLAKRKYGLARCRYTRPGSEIIWARLGLMVMNLKTAFNTGQLVG